MRESTIYILLVVISVGIFHRVSADYKELGKLSRASSTFETGLFFIHGFSSAFFMHFDPRQIEPVQPWFLLGLILIAIGLLATLASMGRLGLTTSVGLEVGRLKQNGLYRYSRNPQIVESPRQNPLVT